MPEIKIQHVVSCSSEDKNNPADNLLKPEGAHKWKCATVGEKNVSVVLQFEKSSQIQSIDIGNEGSAFVEVLVGKSTGSGDSDYQVLLVASTFMSPLESRSGTNRTSVRMFGPDKLSATTIKEKWDRVKVVCSQPFNKTSTFGLSFIKLHSTPSTTDKAQPKTEEKKLGFFKMKTDESGDLKTGSLFAHRDSPADPKPPLTGAAAIRAASRLAEDSKPKTTLPSSSDSSRPSPSSSSGAAEHSHSDSKTDKTASTELKQKRASEVKAEPSAKPSPKQNREKRKHGVSDDDDTEEEEMSKPPLRKQSTSLSSTASKGDKAPPMKKTKSEPPKESPVKEFGKLMDCVIFVMSGYQNPLRGEIRDKALSMGATYKQDWGKSCTHLICAFVNTPKYNQVSGKGRIVGQKWINDCYKQRKLLPWRKYRLGDADSPDEDSEDDYIVPGKASTSKQKHEDKPLKKTQTPPPPVYDDSSDGNQYGGDTDSGEDTEDEIRRAKEGTPKKKTPEKKASPVKVSKSEEDLYDVDTDEDEAGKMEIDDGNDSGLPELPDFFTDKIFFFYGEMSASDRRLLTRYVTAYNGEIEEYMNDKVKYVVTSAKWDDNFDDALSDNPNLIFVKPQWVFKCHEKTKCLPHQPYIVVPDL